MQETPGQSFTTIFSHFHHSQISADMMGILSSHAFSGPSIGIDRGPCPRDLAKLLGNYIYSQIVIVDPTTPLLSSIAPFPQL